MTGKLAGGGAVGSGMTATELIDDYLRARSALQKAITMDMSFPISDLRSDQWTDNGGDPCWGERDCEEWEYVADEGRSRVAIDGLVLFFCLDNGELSWLVFDAAKEVP